MDVIEAIDAWIDEQIDDLTDDELESILEILDAVSASDLAGLDADDVVATADHVVPPAVADVLLELDTEGPEVEKAVVAAVNFGGLEDEATSFRE